LLLIHIVKDCAPESERDPILKGMVLFRFIGATVNHFTQFDIRNEFEEEDGAFHRSQCMKRLVEAIFATVAW